MKKAQIQFADAIDALRVRVGGGVALGLFNLYLKARDEYAQQACEDLRERIAENAKTRTNDESTSIIVDKDSINNTPNYFAMIYYNDKFYTDFEDIKEELEDDGLTGDDLIIEYQECKLEPIITINRSHIHDLVENLCYERDTEDGDYFEKALEVICKHVDLEAINKEMPELWYPQSKGLIELWNDPKGKELTIDLNTI